MTPILMTFLNFILFSGEDLIKISCHPQMVHSPGSPVESPRNDYSSLHQQILEPFGQITMVSKRWAKSQLSLQLTRVFTTVCIGKESFIR